MKLVASTPFRPMSSSSFGSVKKPLDKTAVKKKKPVLDVDPVEIDTTPKKKSKLLQTDFKLDDNVVTVVPQPTRSPIQALTGSLVTSFPSTIVAETFLDETDAVDAETRYKNQRANTAVMSNPTMLTDKVSRKKIRGLTTMFGQRADIILDLLEDDTQTDGALTLIQRTLLQTMVDVLPVVERSVRTSRGKRGVYQLNQCISQIRELTTDIQSLRDRGQLGASVVERVLRPAYLDLASQIIMALTEIDNSAKSRMPDSDHRSFRSEVLEPLKKSIATFVQGQYQDVKEGVISSLS